VFKIIKTKAITALGFNTEETSAISGKLAPVPPITSAMAGPIPIPLIIKTLSKGMAISMRKYNGTPMIDAINIEKILSPPAYFSTISADK